MVVFLACSTLRLNNIQLWLRSSDNLLKRTWCGGGGVVFLAVSTSGNPKKLNFQLWVRLGEKLLKNSWRTRCGGGVVVVWRWWWFGLVFCDNTYPSLGLRLRLWLGCGNYLLMQYEPKVAKLLLISWKLVKQTNWRRKKILKNTQDFPTLEPVVELQKAG